MKNIPINHVRSQLTDVDTRLRLNYMLRNDNGGKRRWLWSNITTLNATCIVMGDYCPAGTVSG